MILSVYAPRPDLTAAAYLIEIIIAEFLFLGPYRKRGSFTCRVIAVHVLLQKRLIDSSIRSFGDTASIHIWNFYKGPITFSSGLPVTNKDEESHGFGMKNMQRIVDEFDGVMEAHTEGEVFNLDIMLPVPSGDRQIL